MEKERFKMVSAVHLLLIKDGKILLLRRFNTGYKDGMFSVPAGHLDGNEFVSQAAIREAKEEVGINIAVNDVDVVGVMHRFSSDERIDFFVTVKSWKGDIINTEPDKCDLLEWYDIENVPSNIIPYINRAIKNYKNSKFYDEYNEND